MTWLEIPLSSTSISVTSSEVNRTRLHGSSAVTVASLSTVVTRAPSPNDAPAERRTDKPFLVIEVQWTSPCSRT